MKRRALLLAPLAAFAAEAPKSAVRGKFLAPGELTTPKGKVQLRGDEATEKVLADPRLNGMDFEALGRFTEANRFVINPIHERAIWAYRNGQRLMVTYWCPVCYIRTYSPGECWCCQDDTQLDLKDPNSKDPTP
ncbi:MAG: hypothetical protein K2X03_11825 [Bryobacteraceae bacterium]|nr:hypothetical protein [Bryobacteraceae bacterium]